MRNPARRVLFQSLLLFTAAMTWSGPLDAQDRFVPAATYLGAHNGDEAATLLSNGQVLVAAGMFHNGTTYVPLNAAQRWHKSAGIWAPTGEFAYSGSLAAARQRAVMASLSDGRAVIGGGALDLWGRMVPEIEIYDSATDSFAPGGTIRTLRHSANAITLPDDRVLFIGGYPMPSSFNMGVYGAQEAELYDANTKTSTYVRMVKGRVGMSSVRLADGRVLVSGGYNDQYPNGFVIDRSLEVYAPATGAFSAAGNLATARRSHASIQLRDGRVLITGGLTGYSGSVATASCELYDPAAGVVVKVIQMNAAHYGHALALLGDGRVLLVGAETPAAEIFDPQTDTFSVPVGQPTIPRRGRAFTLPDGRVLLLGGGDPRCELFLPDGWSPVVNRAPVAQAGPDQVVFAGPAGTAIVTLNGSGSTDPDGDPVALQWSGEFGQAAGTSPAIELPAGIHRISLRAQDPQGLASTDEVLVAVVAGAADSSVVAELRAQLAQLTTQAEDLLAQLQAAEARITALQADNADLNSQLAAARASLVSVQSQLEAANATIQQLNADLVSTRSLVQTLQSQNATLAASNETLQAQLIQAAADLAKARADLQVAAADVQALRDVNGTLTQQLADANTQLAALGALNAQLTAANAQLTAANQQLTQLNAGLVAQIQSLVQLLATSFNDPGFQIPGATPQEQLQNLVTAIDQLNPGQKHALYKNLGGTKK
jgi:predicted  nucleic acid-binding Zn-ribbon protein